MNQKKNSLIYIAGYGRSGSTLLSMLLNTIPNVYNLGELDNLFTVDEATLSEFWKQKKELALAGNGLKENSKVRFSGISWFFKKQKGGNLFKKYWSPVMAGIHEEINPLALIDASKTTNATFMRPYFYNSIGDGVKVIHLVRDLSGVVQSFTKGQNSSNSKELKKAKLGGAYRAIFNWTVTNVLTSLFYKRVLGKKDYYLLSYHDLMNDYEGEMNKLLNFLDLKSNKELFQDDITLHNDISFSGNRVRLNKSVTIKPYPKSKINGFVGILISLASGFTKLFVRH